MQFCFFEANRVLCMNRLIVHLREKRLFFLLKYKTYCSFAFEMEYKPIFLNNEVKVP